MGKIFIRREHEKVPVFIKLNPLGIAVVERMWSIELCTERDDG